MLILWNCDPYWTHVQLYYKIIFPKSDRKDRHHNMTLTFTFDGCFDTRGAIQPNGFSPNVWHAVVFKIYRPLKNQGKILHWSWHNIARRRVTTLWRWLIMLMSWQHCCRFCSHSKCLPIIVIVIALLAILLYKLSFTTWAVLCGILTHPSLLYRL